MKQFLINFLKDLNGLSIGVIGSFLPIIFGDKWVLFFLILFIYVLNYIISKRKAEAIKKAEAKENFQPFFKVLVNRTGRKLRK